MGWLRHARTAPDNSLIPMPELHANLSHRPAPLLRGILARACRHGAVLLAATVCLISCGNDRVARPSGGEEGADTATTTPSGANQPAGTAAAQTAVIRLESALIAQPGLGDVAVTLEAEGVFRLQGTVRTDADRAAALNVARRVVGPATIVDSLHLAR